jgi:hypothetical protein
MERKLRQANAANPAPYGASPVANKVSDWRAGYHANRSRAMISVDQGKERIFGISDATSSHGDSPGERKLGKRIMSHQKDTKIY